MSFKSLIQEMKGEVSSSSKKEWRLGIGARYRSQNVHHRFGISVLQEAKDCEKQNCWASIPPELLRDVISRIDASEIEWPPRKHVIACAGVCRSWRDITKEVVKIPEISGKITFPISLKQPGSRDNFVQCYIKRDRISHNYRLYLGLNQSLAENGKFLLAAQRVRRPTCVDYLISLDAADMSKRSGTYIGKLRCDLDTTDLFYETILNPFYQQQQQQQSLFPH